MCLFHSLDNFGIRFVQNLPPEVREAQQQKLEGLKKQQEIHTRLAAERKIFLRDRKIKFFGKIQNYDYFVGYTIYVI